MARLLYSLLVLLISARSLSGQDAQVWTERSGLMDSGWVVQIPTGSSDFFSVAYNVVDGFGNTAFDTVSRGLPVDGISISIADFGSGLSYPIIGVFEPNTGLDPSGSTPDLSLALISGQDCLICLPVTQFGFGGCWRFPPKYIPDGLNFVNASVQLPPGDSGLLGIGADSGTGAGKSGFTTDGYSTPAVIASFLDFGIGIGQDNSATTSCKQADRKPHGRMRASNLKQGIGEGDELTATVRAGDTLNLAFFGTKSGDKLRLYFNVDPCTPAIAIGPVLPTIPDPDGTGTYLRVNATWPSGFGGQTFRFSAVWGNPACANPGVGFTNCVTVITSPDPTFGVCDDGTVESGWVVQIPSGSSDYFNNNFGNGTGKNGIVALTISCLDFGTTAGGYPTSGVSNANTGVDPSGNTPDIGSPLASVSPFTFPAGSFETTSGLYTSHAVSVPGGSLGTNVHGWVQFPPGDPGLLGVGGDTTQNNGCSFFSLDGYSSPAISFFVNWGIRVKTN